MEAGQAKILQALIVEDSENDTLLLVEHLKQAGFDIQWQRVETESALLLQLETPWDIVFSDYSMPCFSGKRALEIVRAHDPDLPFIFVSGTIGEETAVDGMKAGAQDYVMKGSFARLVPAIERELDEAHSRRKRRHAEQAVRKLSLVVEQAADSVFITNREGQIEYVNPAFERLTGFSADEAIGATPALLKSGLYEPNFYTRMWDVILEGEVFRDVLINRRKDGVLFYEEKTIAPLFDSAQKLTSFVSVGRDITERIEAEEARSQLLEIVEATTDFVAIMDGGGQMRYLNRAGRMMLGLSGTGSVTDIHLGQCHPADETQRLLMEAFPIARREGVWQGESSIRTADGRDIAVSQVILAHGGTDEKPMVFSTIARDITERKHFEEELRRQATHDTLTGLPNRLVLEEHLTTALGRVGREQGFLAVIFLDLDNFKRVNDSLGHMAGDALLRAVAKRLRQCLRSNDIVARYGGDEFTIVVGDLSCMENLLSIIHKLRSAFDASIPIGGQDVYVSFSAGISVCPNDGHDPGTLLKNADAAMYRAKASGRNRYQFYASEMNARGQELLGLETDLRRALERKEFRLYCQPQIDLRTGRIAAFEALLRWQHPQRGLVSPIDFVPLLEETGLIVPVGEWVIREACSQYRRCSEYGYESIRIAVNVSARQFGERGLVDLLGRILREEKIRPTDIELEITESTIMDNVHIAGEILQELDALGVRLAIDDFGTGYSSLAYLKRFPLDVLKIDRVFIQDLPHDENDSAITEASISLGHKLGLEVIAEGVETSAQLQFLRMHGCDMAQGYHLGVPMTIEQAAQFVRTYRPLA